MSKNEADVKAHLITPALTRKGWILEDISHEYSYKIDYEFTAGRIELVDGRVRRGEKKRVDYLLKIPRTQINLAIIEAKSADKGVSEGLSQAMDYANDLKCYFAYASNGSGFVEYNFFTGVQRELKLKDFPTPSEL